MQFDWLVVGAGFTGSTLAERIATELGHKVLVVDRRNHIAGNAYDEHNEVHILEHKYGPHIFHTNSDRVWHYLSRFTSWRPYQHRVVGLVDGIQVPIPFNLDSIDLLFPASQASTFHEALLREHPYGARVPVLKLMESGTPELKEIASFVYEKVFLHYTMKQWDLRPEELDPGVTARVPIVLSRDPRYFQDRHQAMPTAGYTAMFKRMLDHPNIKVLLNTDHREIAQDVHAARTIFTGPIDEFFDHCYGALPYRSLNFKVEHQAVEYAQSVGTVNFPNDNLYTRTTEQKHLSGQTGPWTTLISEYPTTYAPGRNEPYYPVPQEANNTLFKRYADLAAEERPDVTFVGRLADYKYYNMDQACARALAVFDRLAEDVRA